MNKWLSILILVAIPQLASADCVRDKDTNRFQVEDTFVTDRISRLTWMRCPAGQTHNGTTCAGAIAELPWNEADAFANVRAGEWRLPTIEEIETLIDTTCGDKIWPDAFTMPATEIWTASPGFPVNDVAAIVDTANGAIWGTGKGVARAFLLVSGTISADF